MQYSPVIVELYSYSDYLLAVQELIRNSISHFDAINDSSTVYYIILPSWFTDSDLLALSFFETLSVNKINYVVNNSLLSF